MIDFTLLAQSWPYLVQGALVTIKIAFVSSSIGIFLGIVLGLGQTGGNRLVRSLITVYVTLLRGTPMLIQIAFAFYALPQMGINIPGFWAATIAIGLNSGAYISQTIRSGIASVGVGQIEAAKTLGFSKGQITRLIVLPQAIRVVLPALGNEFITLIKDSSLASTVGVMELTKQGMHIASSSFDVLTVYCAIAGIYLILTSLLSLGLARLEHRMNHAHN